MLSYFTSCSFSPQLMYFCPIGVGGDDGDNGGKRCGIDSDGGDKDCVVGSVDGDKRSNVDSNDDDDDDDEYYDDDDGKDSGVCFS